MYTLLRNQYIKCSKKMNEEITEDYSEELENIAGFKQTLMAEFNSIANSSEFNDAFARVKLAKSYVQIVYTEALLNEQVNFDLIAGDLKNTTDLMKYIKKSADNTLKNSGGRRASIIAEDTAVYADLLQLKQHLHQRLRQAKPKL